MKFRKSGNTVLSLLTTALLASTGAVQADYANGPNPYDPTNGSFTPTGQGNFSNYGATPPSDNPAAALNTPSVGYSGTIADPRPYTLGSTPTLPAGPNLAWGGWNRGDAGTAWAEWDTFVEGTPGSRSASAEGMSGTSSATTNWSQGSFKAGSENLYSFTTHEDFRVDIDVSDLTTSSTGHQLALQVEQFAPLEAKWNDDNSAYLQDEPWFLTIDGGSNVDRDVMEHSYFEADHPTSFGPVDLFAGTLIWNLGDLGDARTISIFFDDPVHTALAQVAVDIGPSPVPVPAAVWLMGSALLGLFGVSRRS